MPNENIHLKKLALEHQTKTEDNMTGLPLNGDNKLPDIPKDKPSGPSDASKTTPELDKGFFSFFTFSNHGVHISNHK